VPFCSSELEKAGKDKLLGRCDFGIAQYLGRNKRTVEEIEWIENFATDSVSAARLSARELPVVFYQDRFFVLLSGRSFEYTCSVGRVNVTRTISISGLPAELAVFCCS
jgi:hypothetical protein